MTTMMTILAPAPFATPVTMKTIQESTNNDVGTRFDDRNEQTYSDDSPTTHTGRSTKGVSRKHP